MRMGNGLTCRKAGSGHSASVAKAHSMLEMDWGVKVCMTRAPCRPAACWQAGEAKSLSYRTRDKTSAEESERDATALC